LAKIEATLLVPGEFGQTGDEARPGCRIQLDPEEDMVKLGRLVEPMGRTDDLFHVACHLVRPTSLKLIQTFQQLLATLTKAFDFPSVPCAPRTRGVESIENLLDRGAEPSLGLFHVLCVGSARSDA
jgi:hypothetical protein